MKQNMLKPSNLLLLAAITVTVAVSSCGSSNGTPSTSASADTKSGDAETQILLRRFDSLDFQVYSNQRWDDLRLSHADNIVVHYPDGHTTTGLHDHIEELKPQFVFAPDSKVTEHPIKFGVGSEWTSVVGTLEGTFSQPMPIGGGKTIPPTGKKFKLSMCTVGHWKDGKMSEEYLFWDNQSVMKQIGLAQ